MDDYWGVDSVARVTADFPDEGKDLLWFGWDSEVRPRDEVELKNFAGLCALVF